MSCLGISSLGLSFTPSILGGAPGPHWRDVEAHRVKSDGTLQREEFWRWPNERGVFLGAFYDRDRFPVDPREYAGERVERHEGDSVYESVPGNRVMHLREHIPSGDLYDRARTGPPEIIMTKCFLILWGSVPYTAGMMAMNLVAAVVHTLIVIQEALSAACENGLWAGCATLGGGLYERVGSDLFIVAMSPIYMLGLQAGALVGLISQDDGVRIMDKVERAWHRDASYRDALQYSEYVESGENRRRVPDSVLDEIMTKTYIMAWCLLRRGNRVDPQFAFIQEPQANNV